MISKQLLSIKHFWFILTIKLFLFQVTTGQQSQIETTGQSSVLIVNDQPFLILGGELGNSSAATSEDIKTIFPKLKKLNLNTVLAPVYWELLEPVQEEFDFTLVDELINTARENDLKLILLWFGSWKNSMSCYTPAWIKTNEARYPRAKMKDGKSVEILSPFSTQNLNADKKAFTQLMNHLKKVDDNEKTVIMVQVENEIGLIPNARDYSTMAQNAFKQDVPPQLIELLKASSNELHPHLKNMWIENGSKTSGNWETIFGKGLYTDELFMAWHFAIYTEQIAKAGKDQYNLPLFVNAALNSRGRKPGAYPSAGPLAHLFDIWKLAAPSIDFCALDIYDKGFADWIAQYDTKNNPLFIPEIRNEEANAARVFYAIGKHKALGFSPFSIEGCDLNDPIAKSYAILNSISPIIAKTPKPEMTGVWFNDELTSDTIQLNGWTIKVSHDYTLGWDAKAKDGSTWPETAALVISMPNNHFLVAGTGVVFIVISGPKKDKQSGILTADRVTMLNGKISTSKRLNGDQTHQGRHIRIPVNNFEIQLFSYYQYK